MLRERVLTQARDFQERVIAIRQHLHRHPELSFQEELTGRFVQEVLSEIGVSHTGGWAGHGVVGLVEGNRPDSGVVALRADMDALPIQEANDVPYRSTNDGVMHACGHDAHTASLLGAAMILQSQRQKFDGTVKLIFQPGEEKAPGGASVMIREGVLESPRPAGIIGQHVYPLLPAGTVGFKPGKFMASSDEITMRVVGKGGHGAVPHFTVDPIAVSAQIISALQQVVSRSSNPTTPSVLTLGKIESEGGSFNVIPNAVRVWGTFRTFDEEWRYKAHEKIRSIAEGVAQSFGATCELDIMVGYPYLVNHQELTMRCRAAAEELLGADNVRDIPMRMTSEDFAYYTHHAAGCFYRLGVANERKGIGSPVHTATFDVDDEALATGPAMLAWLAISELAHLNARN